MGNGTLVLREVIEPLAQIFALLGKSQRENMVWFNPPNNDMWGIYGRDLYQIICFRILMIGSLVPLVPLWPRGCYIFVPRSIEVQGSWSSTWPGATQRVDHWVCGIVCAFILLWAMQHAASKSSIANQDQPRDYYILLPFFWTTNLYKYIKWKLVNSQRGPAACNNARQKVCGSLSQVPSSD